MDGPSDPDLGITKRLAPTLALWLSLAIGCYVAFWGLLLISSPHARWGRFFEVLWNSARFYGPVFVLAMTPPAILHLFAPGRAALWSKLFLLLSIVLPAVYFMMIRTQYLRETARGVHVEGVGLWNAFAYVSGLGLYTSTVSLIFAVLLREAEMRTQRRCAHLAAATAVVMFYVALFFSGFAPFFMVLYR